MQPEVAYVAGSAPFHSKFLLKINRPYLRGGFPVEQADDPATGRCLANPSRAVGIFVIVTEGPRNKAGIVQAVELRVLVNPAIPTDRIVLVRDGKGGAAHYHQ